MRKGIGKKIISILLSLSFVISLGANAIISQAADEKYDATTVANYRATGTYPTEDGKVFAGWYADADYADPVLENEVASDGAYAKFVDEAVLSAKCQISSGATEDDETTSLRMLTSVNDRNYQSVGFDVKIDGRMTQSYTSDTVYTTVYGYTYEDDNGEKQSYTPNVFSNASNYFMTYTMTVIPNASFKTQIDITPKWVTLDGTTVTGIKKEFFVINGLEKYEAMIGSTPYDTLEAAIADANASDTDVTIEMLKDVDVIETSTVTINNEKNKNFTIDGNGYKLTTVSPATSTKVAFDVKQVEGRVTFKNMVLYHESGNALVRYTSGVNSAENPRDMSITFSDVEIYATKDTTGYYPWGVFNLADSGKIELNLIRTYIKMQRSSATDGSNTDAKVSTVIRVDGANQTANITMADSYIDVTEAESRSGISVTNKSGLATTITLVNSKIETKNQYPIYKRVGNTDNGATVTVYRDSATVLASKDATKAKVYADDNDITDDTTNTTIEAQIENVPYATFVSAITAANKLSDDTTITMLSDTSCNEVSISNTNNKNLTIDGNGYAITAVDGDNHARKMGFNILQQEGTINFNDMTIYHDSGNALVRTRTKTSNDELLQDLTVNFTDVDIFSENDIAGHYPWGVFNLADKGSVDLNLIRTNIKMSISTADTTIVNGTSGHFTAIRVDASGEATVTLKDSVIDVTAALDRTGMDITGKASTTVAINLENSTIATQNNYSILLSKVVDGSTTIVTSDSKCKLTSLDAAMAANPVKDATWNPDTTE